MKKYYLLLSFLSISIIVFAQSKNDEAVKAVLKNYKTKIEQLDTTGISNLFVKKSNVYENGGSEGTISHYLEHHLGPELKDFKSFNFNNYKIDVQVDGNYAFTTESYNYVIVLAKNNTEIKRNGVATSVLKKTNGEWKIINTHSSSRK